MRGHRVSASNVIFGRQNVDVTVALSGFTYSATTGIFGLNATIKNLLNQPLGTTDGVNSTANATRIFFYTLPAVTHGVGTITVNNANGTGFFTQSRPQPYYQYASPIAPNGTSASKTWQLKLTGSVTAFNFALEINAALPAEKSIRRWVALRQGLTSDSLTSVWMRSASDMYAVGLGGTLLEWNGTTWGTVAAPAPSANYRAVSGVAQHSGVRLGGGRWRCIDPRYGRGLDPDRDPDDQQPVRCVGRIPRQRLRCGCWRDDSPLFQWRVGHNDSTRRRLSHTPQRVGRGQRARGPPATTGRSSSTTAAVGSSSLPERRRHSPACGVMP